MIRNYDQSNDMLFTSYKEYIVLPHIVKSQNYNTSDVIVLILHISHDQNLTKIRNHIKNWEGFISLTIYININKPNLDELTCTYCKIISITKYSKKVDIHFVIKMSNYLYSIKQFTMFKESYNCEKLYNNIEERICSQKSKNVMENAKKLLQYPINILRNIGRKYTKAKYIVIADVDHMFSKGFHNKMLSTAKKVLKKDKKAVLVYRIFEVDYEKLEDGPENKKELEGMMKNNKAFIFHHTFKGGHDISKLDEWFAVPDSPVPTIQIEEKFRRFGWEPQFVSLTNIPYHDERFPYPNHDNTNLRWALCMMGYKFLIVNDVFMYHLGLKSFNESHQVGLAKEMSVPIFQEAFDKFKNEMIDKYSKNTKKCHF
uniref:N-acetyllactosaminide beta-1,3-N-acetylglucosaminyltransferase n=1 Tax=Strongyloides papillosus TaxID=174720 RepID=A0A0N5BIS1_STREA